MLKLDLMLAFGAENESGSKTTRYYAGPAVLRVWAPRYSTLFGCRSSRISRERSLMRKTVKKLQLALVKKGMDTEAAELDSECPRTTMYPSDVENYWISCAPKEVIYAWLDATPECTEDANPDARAETSWPELDSWDMS